MNNLKKVLALVLAFTLVLGLGVFAAPFTDVTDDATYAEAVTMLSSLNILTGYEDGTFKPDGTITRAEFAKVIVCAMGNADGAAASAGANTFSDVPATHWAAGYINSAAGLGIIAGMGDGTFAPESPVTYEQAVKMIVSALGYAPMAQYAGGYPTGYLTIASNSIKITKGATGTGSEPAKRWVVARLVFNSLEVPMMEQKSFNPNSPEYTIPTDDYKTLLKDYLGIDKVEGIITGTKYTAGTLDKDNNDVKIVATKINADKVDSESYTVDAGETNADAYLGQAVTVYVTDLEESDTPTVMAIAPRSGYNTSKTLDFTAFDGEDTVSSANGGKYGISYYNDRDNDKKTSKLYVSEEAVTVRNGVIIAEDFDDETQDLFNGLDDETKRDGSVVFIDNNKDDVYEYIVITELVGSYVVDSASEKNYKLSLKNSNRTLTLDPEDEDKIINIYKDGKLVDFSAFEEDDVISVVADVDYSDRIDAVIGNVNENATIVNIYISTDTIEGFVSSVKDGTYTIDGKKYKAASGVEIAAGTEGTFYLNINGKLVYCEGEGSRSRTEGNYGVILTASIVSGDMDDEVLKLRIVDQNGKSASYEVDKRVYLYTSADKEERVGKDADMTEMFENFGDLPMFNYKNGKMELVGEAKDRIMKYVVKDDIITKIYFPDTELDSDYLFKTDMSDAIFDADDNDFTADDVYSVDDNTIVFQFTNGAGEETKIDASDVKVTKVASAFKDEQKYSIIGFDPTDDGVFRAVAVYKGEDAIPNDTSFFVATEDEGEGYKDNDSDMVAIYKGYLNGEEKEFYVSEDGATFTDETAESNKDNEFEVEFGDVLQLSFDANGDVIGVRRLFSVDAAMKGTVLGYDAESGAMDFSGFADSKTSSSSKLNLYTSVDTALAKLVKSFNYSGSKFLDECYYTVDLTLNKAKVVVDGEIIENSFDSREEAENEEVSLVYTRIVQGDTVGVVSYTMDADSAAFWTAD